MYVYIRYINMQLFTSAISYTKSFATTAACLSEATYTVSHRDGLRQITIKGKVNLRLQT
jgi:2-methylaconitate cis-trans-isomerase PrpF